MTDLSCNVIAMGFSFQPLTQPFPYFVVTAWYHMGLLSAKSLHPETIQTWEGQGWPRRGLPVTGKKCEAPLSVKNKKNLLWREESPVFCFLKEMHPVWTADSKADVFLWWRILHSAAFPSTVLGCQSVVFEIAQAVTAGWHWACVGSL